MKYKKIVIKIGSSVLTKPDGSIDTSAIESLVLQISQALVRKLSWQRRAHPYIRHTGVADTHTRAGLPWPARTSQE